MLLATFMSSFFFPSLKAAISNLNVLKYQYLRSVQKKKFCVLLLVCQNFWVLIKSSKIQQKIDKEIFKTKNEKNLSMAKFYETIDTEN